MALIFGVNFLAFDRIYLLGAFLFGSFAALIYIFLQGQRIKIAEKKSARSAKINMFIGLVLRLLFVFVVFGVAANINTEVFFAMTVGFLLFYVIFYLCAIVENLKK